MHPTSQGRAQAWLREGGTDTSHCPRPGEASVPGPLWKPERTGLRPGISNPWRGSSGRCPVSSGAETCLWIPRWLPWREQQDLALTSWVACVQGEGEAPKHVFAPAGTHRQGLRWLWGRAGSGHRGRAGPFGGTPGRSSPAQRPDCRWCPTQAAAAPPGGREPLGRPLCPSRWVGADSDLPHENGFATTRFTEGFLVADSCSD